MPVFVVSCVLQFRDERGTRKIGGSGSHTASACSGVAGVHQSFAPDGRHGKSRERPSFILAKPVTASLPAHFILLDPR